MSIAERIVRRMLEGEMDDFVHAAVGPTLTAWARQDKHEEGRFIWATPTHINEQEAEFWLVIDLDHDIPNSNPPRKAISMMQGLVDLSGQLTTYGHWFGFTYLNEEGQQHILNGIYRARDAMVPVLEKPVRWKRREALATAAGKRFDFMHRTIYEHVMQPKARDLGITYFTGSPRAEDEAPYAGLWA